MTKKKSKFGGRRLTHVTTYPKGKRKRVTPKEDLEAAVQKEVLQYARRLGVPLWRQNAGAVHSGDVHMVLAPEGAADLTGFLSIGDKLRGTRLEVECKRRSGGRQSKAQKMWQEEVEAADVIYLIVTSGEDFETQLRLILSAYDCAHCLPSVLGGGFYERRDELKKQKVPKKL